MEIYKHTQIGYWIIGILGLSIIYIAILMFFYEPIWEATIVLSVVLFILIICLILFSTLTVTIEQDFLKIQFGLIKAIQKKFYLKEVKMHKVIDIPWYHRWNLGISLISNGWLYNISGSKKAIEIQMTIGKKYQISTNDWQKLEQVIEQAIR